ncbi:putative E3 ubiquitin-protein ligase UBR7 [Hippoglossus stenolepis]|uniref:putative E3 ubiquitin-protein ligase UBR7 n=1 Tax=Hippoglossus stenolepis TaxID=195615 RepID=UPI001FAF37A5|nr:putative E3 ubiquitin-protein ligase UBR7 [Hippoglossus stenolepis]
MAEQREESELHDAAASEEELETALCVLAGSDPENCSYSRGYVKRQAVFACNTCTPSAAEPAGICLACANKCHDGHDIFELYTKRNFRCDCGNSKFGDFQCQLMSAKDEENVRNQYNHNFSGFYCTCDRPYPDTDDQVNDEMIQCVVCEDWFHSRHLGCSAVEPEELQEMVCEACMNKAPVLWTYAAHFAVPPVISVSHPEEEEGEEEEVEVDVEEQGDKEESRQSGEEATSSVEDTKQEEAVNQGSPGKRTHEQMTGSPGKATTKSEACRLKKLQDQGRERLRQGAVFWPYSWRSELCTCTSCKRAYVAAEVQFLMDQSDTILAYENKGLDEPFGQHPLMALTSSMDRVQQLEIIYGFNELTTSISAFLHQCVADGKTLTVEAVHQFFDELRARKRRRTNAGYQ